MKLTLSVSERLSIAQFLPKEGNLSEQLIGKSILNKSLITTKEREGLRFDPLYEGRINRDTEFVTTLDFSAEEFELLYSNFLQMDKDKKINASNVDLALSIRTAKGKEDKVK